MEQVAHRVHEDDAGLPPSKGNHQGIGVRRDPKARPAGPRIAVGLVLRVAHGLEPLRQRERLAVVAPGRHAIAPGRWVPGGLGPLDRASVGHTPTLADRTLVRRKPPGHVFGHGPGRRAPGVEGRLPWNHMTARLAPNFTTNTPRTVAHRRTSSNIAGLPAEGPLTCSRRSGALCPGGGRSRIRTWVALATDLQAPGHKPLTWTDVT
jgi:hypothetical protein